MKTVGGILKKARQEKNLSLEEIEKALKIRKSYLEALESSDYAHLPAPVFMKGFLKAYARFLGLKETEVIAFWRREYDENARFKKGAQPPPQPLKKVKVILTPGLIVGLFAIIGVVGFLIYIYSQYSSFALSPVLIIDKPLDSERLKVPFTEVVGRTDPEAKVTINGQEIRVVESGAFAVNVDLAAGENTIEVAATNKLGRKSVETRKVWVEETTPSASLVEQESPQVYSDVEVEVLADPEAAWLSVEEDGVKTYEGVLSAGAKRQFKAKEVVKIRTGKADSTRVTVNGKDMGLMGMSPDPAEREYRKD